MYPQSGALTLNAEKDIDNNPPKLKVYVVFTFCIFTL